MEIVFQCKKVNIFYQILAQELKSTQENHLHYQFALFCHNILAPSLNIKLQVQCLFFKTDAISWGKNLIWLARFPVHKFLPKKKWETLV